MLTNLHRCLVQPFLQAAYLPAVKRESLLVRTYNDTYNDTYKRDNQPVSRGILTTSNRETRWKENFSWFKLNHLL